MARAKKAFVVTLLLLKNRRLTTKILTILKTNYNKNELIKLKQTNRKVKLKEKYYEIKKSNQLPCNHTDGPCPDGGFGKHIYS